jgi:hypothetical protein
MGEIYVGPLRTSIHSIIDSPYIYTLCNIARFLLNQIVILSDEMTYSLVDD